MFFADTVLNTVSRDPTLHRFLSVLSPRHAIAYHYISSARVRGRRRGMDALRVEKWNSNRSLAVDFVSPCFAFPVVRDNNVVSVRTERSIDRSIPPLSRNLFLLLFLDHFSFPFPHFVLSIYLCVSLLRIGEGAESENRASLFFFLWNEENNDSFYFLIAENCYFECYVEKTGGKLRAGIRTATFH